MNDNDECDAPTYTTPLKPKPLPADGGGDESESESESKSGSTPVTLSITSVSETQIETEADKTVTEIRELINSGEFVYFRLVLEQGFGDFLPGTYFLYPAFTNESGVMATTSTNTTTFQYTQMGTGAEGLIRFYNS